MTPGKSDQNKMCFSAAASFSTAGVTAVIGIIALSRISCWRELPLAAAPIVFAAQQSIEGLLWLDLPVDPDGAAASALTLMFLLVAEVFWPVYAPLAMLLIERSKTRRLVMAPWLAVGAGAAAYLLWGILTRQPSARILDDHIVYVTQARFSLAVGLAYFGAVGLPLMLSTQRAVAVFGAIVLAGFLTAYVFYWEAFVSVWCFFAAAASAVILFHFEQVARQRLVIVGA